jgi:hypothetical protein
MTMETDATNMASHILKIGCFTLLIILASFIGCCTFIDSRYHHDADRAWANALDCAGQLHKIGEGLYYLTQPDKMPESLRSKVETGLKVTPDMTVADLIREGVQRGFLNDSLDGKYLRCARTGEPYLVLPVPASVLFLDCDPQNRIPIVMDPPHAHDESKSLTFVCRLFFGHSSKFISTARVLYADGGVVTISREEAEKLVAEQSPVPLEIVFETGLAGPDKKDDRK